MSDTTVDITTNEAYVAAWRELVESAGIPTATVKTGYCPKLGCTVAHHVMQVEIWTNHPQWQGTHHNGTYVYETFMVTREN